MSLISEAISEAVQAMREVRNEVSEHRATVAPSLREASETLQLVREIHTAVVKQPD